MPVESRRDVTLILGKARAGDHSAHNELISLIYEELRRMAGSLMRRERPDHTLAPTAVVHEAVIRLLGDEVFERAEDRSFLFASAARAMREVLIDHARKRGAGRRGGGWRRKPLDTIVDDIEAQGMDVVAIHEALERLEVLNSRQSQVVTLRYFGGMTVPEVASALGVAVVTVERDWRLARAWLMGQLQEGEGNDAGTMAPD